MPTPLKQKGKRREVKGWARVLNADADDSLSGLVEFTNGEHSLEIYEEKSEAISKNKRMESERFIKVVPVTIIYYV